MFSLQAIKHRWLCDNTDRVWQAKPLAMWLPLSAKTGMTHVAHWYIPYFDRSRTTYGDEEFLLQD